MEYKDYSDEELFNEYCSFYFMNYVYNTICLSELRRMALMELEIDEHRTQDFKRVLLEECKKLDTIDLDTLKWEKV